MSVRGELKNTLLKTSDKSYYNIKVEGPEGAKNSVK